MSEISTLTIKIPLALKEKIRAAAAENEFSLSVEVCQRLESSFNAPIVKAEKPAKKADDLHHGE
ncbi:hypothetical protein, partial [Neorhizobium alkalisoli]|uniref:hypothetical protein n=2 Tax=Pseudomonadota TaxID=1224 RepID=UPI00197B31EC